MEFSPGLGEPSHADFVDSPNGWLQPSLISCCFENQHNLLRFGENSGYIPRGVPRPKLKCSKRKLDFDQNPKPMKMQITEEAMAKQLKNMHISNDFINNKDFNDDLDNCERLLPTLSLSKEVQNLPIFNPALIPEREKPTRALVLWKPPSGSLRTQLIQRLCNNYDDETANTNNNVSTTDLNVTASRGVNQSTDMEL